uniref:Uncharacterized protein n=1 Tax=Arcella intermedia TaxID=1963864 RepID=A0A6B2KYT3_9EUKA
MDEFKMKLKKREEQQKRRSIEQPKAIPKEEEKKINLQLITQEWKNKKNLLKKAQEQKSNPSLLSDAPKDSPKPDKLSEKPEVTHVPSPLPKPGANLDNFVPKVPLKVEHEDSGDDEDRLQKILEALPLNHLTVVDLKAMGLEDPDVSQVLSGLITNKSVTTLLLDGNEMDTHSFNNLNEVLLKNQVLNHICLNFVVLGENGALAIQSGLSKNHSVTYLSLVGSDLFENGMAALAVGLKQNSTITVLNLSENSISDTGCNYLSELFDENSTITNLNISNNYINEEGATYLSNIITKNSSLTSLNLERNSIEDGGCIAISDALKENSTLKELYLGNNILETWGMKVLADSLADNQGLEVVDLRENIFEIESEIALQDAMMRRKGKLNVLWRKGKGEVEMSKSDMSAIIEYFGPTQIIDTFKKNMNLLPLVDIELVLNHIKYERTEALMMWEISFNQGSGYCHPLQLLNNILKIQTADSVSNKDFCTIFMENLDRICKILKPEPTDRVLHFKKLQTFQLTKNIIKTDDPAVSIAVLKSPLLNNITDLFFQFPNNSIFLTEFVDLLEHLLFSPSPSSFNLLSFLFVQSGFFHKLITNFLSESDSDFTSRKGYFGHMTKIFNKTKEAASKNPKFEKIFEAFPLWPQLVEKLEEINAVTITPAHLKPPENTNKKSALNEFDDSVM